jgi:carbon starvation protein
MNAMVLVITALVFFALAYRFYFSFFAAKVLVINDSRPTPAGRLYDKQNYVPMSKWVLFGHHFAAIAGAGPLVGPVLAAQFGYFPGFLWMLVGAVMAGAMHDVVILTASVRHDGKSLAEIARREIGTVSGLVASVAILIIIIVALAGLGGVVVNALSESAWGTFTIAATIPIAILMGLWMFKFRKGRTAEATAIGVVLLALAVIVGRWVPESAIGGWFTFSKTWLTILMCIYGFLASVLPVWLLLSPRDYLSSIMKLGVIAMLAGGVIVVMPTIRMPAVTDFAHGGGPIIPGTLFPYLFITIACGAVSGFHSLVSSGTTPKMIMRESHIRPIAVGGMLAEGLVSVLALVAATSLAPTDYFLINCQPAQVPQVLRTTMPEGTDARAIETELAGLRVPPEKMGDYLKDIGSLDKPTPEYVTRIQAIGQGETNLQTLSNEVEENVVGRPGGAVSLAVGMAQIFSSIPGLAGLMSYWYHFAIMFEALFILTTIDAGTRIARFILQEAGGKIYAPLGRTNWLPGNLVASALVVAAWGYFILTGSIYTIWPMFGTANQLLACTALAIGTSFLINRGKVRYAWTTIVPMVFVGAVTLTAGTENIIFQYLPKMADKSTFVWGLINTTLTVIIMVAALIIIGDALPKWIRAARGRPVYVDPATPDTDKKDTFGKLPDVGELGD